MPVSRSKIPTAKMLQMPQNPWTSDMSRGSSISFLTMIVLVELKMTEPMRPITQAAHSSIFEDEEVTETSPAKTALQSCLIS